MHKITIENFGPIHDVTLNTTQLTLVVGEQANGKSTIAKLIYYFRRFQVFFSTIYTANEFSSWTEFRKAYLSQMKTIFTNTFGNTKTLGNFKLVYSFSDVDCITITPSTNNAFLNIQFSPPLNYKLRNVWYHTSKISHDFNFANDMQLKVREIQALDALSDVFDDQYSCMYIPAGRALLSRQALLDLIQTNELSVALRPTNYSAFDLIDAVTRDYMREVSSMRSILSRKELYSFVDTIDDPTRQDAFLYMCNLQKEILKGTYDTDGKRDYVVLNSNKRIPVSYASSGQQEVLWITNLLLGFVARGGKKSCVLVEEPETHLHPDAQYALVKFIAAYQNVTESQVFITTHSPYILSSLNNLFYAAKTSKRKKANDIDSIIPKVSWINEKCFQSFSIENGLLVDITDPDLSMIDISILDSIASKQDDEYEAILRLPQENE